MNSDQLDPKMTLAQLKIQFKNALKKTYPNTEVESFFNILTEDYLGMRRIDVALNPDFKLSEAQQKQFQMALDKLKKEVPIQYITGETEFYGLKFKVDPGVLIPRPETEELVAWVLSDFKKKPQKLRILDIGTGSGCIPISVKKHLPQAEVVAVDISEEALKTAKKNAETNQVEVAFSQLDVLACAALDKKYDIIISNPPYVMNNEKNNMRLNVIDYEPPVALYVEDEDPLKFYKKITKLAQNSLSDDGILYFEINEHLEQESLALVEQYGFKAELKKDIFDKYRLLKAEKIKKNESI